MAKTRTTIPLEKDLPGQFKRLALSIHETTRNLISEIDEALRTFSPFEIRSSMSRKLDQKIGHLSSLKEMVDGRLRWSMMRKSASTGDSRPWT